MVDKLTRNFSFLLICASLSTYAQDQKQISDTRESFPQRKRFISKVEFLIGPSLVYVHGDEGYKKIRRPKLGFSSTIGLTRPLSQRLDLGLNLSYEKKGSKTIVHSLNSDYTPPVTQIHIADIDFNYLNATLLPRYSITKNQRLVIGLGAYLGYMLSTKFYQEVYLNGSFFSRSGGRPDPSESNKLYDAGLTMMTGYNFPIRKKSATIQLFYNHGTRDFNKPMFAQIRNNSICFLFGTTVNQTSHVKF